MSKQNYIKNNADPATAITAPTTSKSFTRCLSINTAGGIMSIGVSPIRVLTIPVLVCCIAKSESATPKNGPKIEPIKVKRIPWLSFGL